MNIEKEIERKMNKSVERERERSNEWSHSSCLSVPFEFFCPSPFSSTRSVMLPSLLIMLSMIVMLTVNSVQRIIIIFQSNVMVKVQPSPFTCPRGTLRFCSALHNLYWTWLPFNLTNFSRQKGTRNVLFLSLS